MRSILFTFCLLAALPARAADPALLSMLDALRPRPDFEAEAPLLIKGSYYKVAQGSVSDDPSEGRHVQELAKKVEADIEEELK
jgi:hypothetical protein